MCVVWSAVDAAEDEENRAKVHLVNAIGTENIDKVCKKLNSKMMYISTDYVFNGEGTELWKPDCKAYYSMSMVRQNLRRDCRIISA